MSDVKTKVDPNMTLEEYCAKLPLFHKVNEQLSVLRADTRKAHPKYATTGELFTELIARATIDGSINYRTIDIVKRQLRQLEEIKLERKTVERLAKLQVSENKEKINE